MRTRAFRVISRRLTIIVGIPVRLELQQSFLQFHTRHLFRVQVRGKRNDFVASTLDQRRIFVCSLLAETKFSPISIEAPHPGPGSWHKYQDYHRDSSAPLAKVINGRQPMAS
jgi:hypothetical protein